VVGIRLETNQSRFREQVRNPLHTLARHPHSAGDLRNGASRSDGHEYLPASSRLFLEPGDILPPGLVQTRQGKGLVQDSLGSVFWHFDSFRSFRQ
jgi:hypothetical protein